MELLQLTQSTIEIFDVKDIKNLRKGIEQAVIHNDFSKYLEFEKLVGDLTVDWLQKIFQYYEADRAKKKQDYTPKSLAGLVARLTQMEYDVCVDLCAGSGALTIQKWAVDKSVKFICLEYDETVIPYLLFNLAIRNIRATVINCDVLSGDVIAKYEVISSEKYSVVSMEKDKTFKVEAKTCISNPPFNMRWEIPVCANMQERFCMYGLPPESNANYAFVLTALSYADTVAMILPASILVSGNKKECEIVKRLIENNFIEAVISCPDRMFESTSIATCVIKLNKRKKHSNIEFIDMRDHSDSEQREQNGQFGGASHMRRTYIKTVNVFSDEQIQFILSAIQEQRNEVNKCVSVTIAKVKECGYMLNPSRYIGIKEAETDHRSYADIIRDLNHCIEMKNSCKLTINETIAKQLGFDVESFKSDKELGDEEFLQKISGVKLLKKNYITFTKNKNEVTFSNGSKELVSPVFMLLFNQWKQLIYMWNIEENRYLAELRDCLLPDLMLGKISVNDADTDTEQ